MCSIVGVVHLLLLSLLLSASPQLEMARAEDAALRRSEERLRVRDNITRVIELWKDARRTADRDADKHEATRGLIDAYALLARRSGRSTDAARAETIVRELQPRQLRKVVVDGTTLRIDASGDYSTEANTYGDRRLYFDLTPVVAVKQALGDLAMRGAERTRVTQLDTDTVRIVLDFEGGLPKYEITDRTIRLKLSTLDSRLSTPAKIAKRSERRSPLAIRKVVIDPGHGGKDTGAIGK